MSRKIAFLLPALLLSACGTPQEQCIRRNTGELRVVEQLLAETEANLARGYAWREKQVERTVWRDCEYLREGDNGEIELRRRPCLRDVVETERYRDPIDPVAEMRKRDNLVRKRDRLAARAQEAVRQCRALHPE